MWYKVTRHTGCNCLTGMTFSLPSYQAYHTHFRNTQQASMMLLEQYIPQLWKPLSVPLGCMHTDSACCLLIRTLATQFHIEVAMCLNSLLIKTWSYIPLYHFAVLCNRLCSHLQRRFIKKVLWRKRNDLIICAACMSSNHLLASYQSIE